MIDVVYTLGTASRHGDAELRYSLRSYCRFFEDLGHVWIVGHKPDWVGPGVRHLPAGDPWPIKDANILDKLRLACEQPELSERFVFASDDQVVLRPMVWPMLGPYHNGDLAGRTHWPTTWWRRLRATRDFLAARGRSTWHGDAHVPIPMHKAEVLRLCHDVDYRRPPGLCVGTLLLNWTEAEARPLGDRKATIESTMTAEEIRRRVAGRWFLGHNDAGFTAELWTVLDGMFSEECRFEREPNGPAGPVKSGTPSARGPERSTSLESRHEP